MIKENMINKLLLFGVVAVGLSACTKKLDLVPTNGTNSANLFTSASTYKQVLAKVYGSFATTGSSGAGSGDIQGTFSNHCDPGLSLATGAPCLSWVWHLRDRGECDSSSAKL